MHITKDYFGSQMTVIFMSVCAQSTINLHNHGMGMKQQSMHSIISLVLAMLKIVPKDFKDHFFLEVISVQCSELCRKLTRILCVFFVLSYCSHGRDSIPSYGANGAIVIWKLHRCFEHVQCKRCWCQQTKIPRLVEQYQWQIFLFLLHHYVNLNWPPSSHNIFVPYYWGEAEH